MRKFLIAAILLITACSKQNEAQKLNTYDVEEPAATAPASGAAQIAYSYEIGYELGTGRIAAVQAAHADACRRLGTARCLVLESSINDRADQGASGSSTLLVDARLAPAFGKRLDSQVSGAGGSVADRRTGAEDVTKQVIDAGARVRAKEALAERLLVLIRSVDGTVADLVAAEKAYADTQEELAAARSLQAALRQRVAMSRFELRYSASESAAPLAPVHQAIGSAAETVGWSLGTMITLILAALPWVIGIAALAWLNRRLGWRGPIAWWHNRRNRRLAP